jgi:hypothetical protein
MRPLALPSIDNGTVVDIVFVPTLSVVVPTSV